jgi:hypothetical protein
VENKLKLTRLTLHNAIHILLLLLLATVVILFIVNSNLLLTDNAFINAIKYLTKLTIYKLVILNYSQSMPAADAYLSMAYLIFIFLFINIYFMSTEYKGFCMHDAAIRNMYNFSGVTSIHIYSKLFPSVDLSNSYKKYTSKIPTKNFDEFLIEQLDSEGTKTHFMIFTALGFVIFPLIAVYLAEANTGHLVKYWLACLAMIYFQTRIIFEAFLIFKALAR